MTCQERRDLLLLYVAGALEPAEAAELRRHLLTGCPVCAGALAEAEAVVHRIPEGLAPVGMPEGAWERIESRIAVREELEGEEQSRPSEVPAAARKWSVAWVGWAAAAVVAIVLGLQMDRMNRSVQEAQAKFIQADTDRVVANGMLASAERDRDAAVAAETAAENSGKELNVRMTSLEMQVKALMLQNEHVHLELASVRKGEMERMKHIMDSQEYEVAAKDMKDVRGTIYICRGDGECMLVAANLKALPAGKTFEAWMIDDKGKAMAAGTFKMDEEGMAMHVAKIPAGMSLTGQFAVTDEPMGGVDQPTGSVLFAAVIK